MQEIHMCHNTRLQHLVYAINIINASILYHAMTSNHGCKNCLFTSLAVYNTSITCMQVVVMENNGIRYSRG